jgi:TolA-binding protein
MMKKAILSAVIGLFSLSSLSHAEDNSPILDYYKPVNVDSLDKRVNYLESIFNAKIENVMEQIKAVQNKQNDYESAMKYMASQTKKEIEELKAQVDTLTEEVARLKGEKSSITALQPKESAKFCTIQSQAFITDKGKAIAKIDKGIKLEILDEAKKSYKVKYDNKIGYIGKKYCKLGD